MGGIWRFSLFPQVDQAVLFGLESEEGPIMRQMGSCLTVTIIRVSVGAATRALHVAPGLPTSAIAVALTAHKLASLLPTFVFLPAKHSKQPKHHALIKGISLLNRSYYAGNYRPILNGIYPTMHYRGTCCGDYDINTKQRLGHGLETNVYISSNGSLQRRAIA